MNEAEVDKAMKNAALKNTNNLITKREGDLVETQNDLKNTQVELDAALASLARMACTHMKSKLCHSKARIPLTCLEISDFIHNVFLIQVPSASEFTIFG